MVLSRFYGIQFNGEFAELWQLQSIAPSGNRHFASPIFELSFFAPVRFRPLGWQVVNIPLPDRASVVRRRRGRRSELVQVQPVAADLALVEVLARPFVGSNGYRRQTRSNPFRKTPSGPNVLTCCTKPELRF